MQRELLAVIAELPMTNEEFTIKDIAQKSSEILVKPFKPANINNMLTKIVDFGFIFKIKGANILSRYHSWQTISIDKKKKTMRRLNINKQLFPPANIVLPIQRPS